MNHPLIDTISTFIFKYLYPKSKNKKYEIYKSKDGLKIKMRVGSSDKIEILDVIVYNRYSNKGFDIKPADTIIDAGASIGSYSLLAAKKAYAGKVYSYEPDVNSFKLLSYNKKQNSFNNLFVFNKAIWSEKDKLSFYTNNRDSMGSSLNYRNTKTSYLVETTTIRDIILDNKIKKIDILKMDIEGAEYKIFNSLKQKELRKINKIILEFHDYNTKSKTSHHKIIKKLKDQNFNVSVENAFPLSQKLFKMGIIKAVR